MGAIGTLLIKSTTVRASVYLTDNEDVAEDYYGGETV